MGASEASEVFARIPFFFEHIRLRTRYMDDAVRRALTAGVRDIILVGAGFDCRSLRMPEIAAAGARVVEVDHQAQLDEKRRRLTAAGVSIPEYVVPAPADLAVEGELERALAGAGVAEGSRVLWVCEGLLGYLGRDEVRALAEATSRGCGPGSFLVANHSETSWSSETLVGLFEAATWRASRGPSFEALHRTHIGAEVPPGSEAFALLEATR